MLIYVCWLTAVLVYDEPTSKVLLFCDENASVTATSVLIRPPLLSSAREECKSHRGHWHTDGTINITKELVWLQISGLSSDHSCCCQVQAWFCWCRLGSSAAERKVISIWCPVKAAEVLLRYIIIHILLSRCHVLNLNWTWTQTGGFILFIYIFDFGWSKQVSNQ